VQLVDARPSSGVSGIQFPHRASMFRAESESESSRADTNPSHGKAGRHDEDQPGCASLVVWRGVERGAWGVVVA
jgi:hypothetical protein